VVNCLPVLSISLMRALPIGEAILVQDKDGDSSTITSNQMRLVPAKYSQVGLILMDPATLELTKVRAITRVS
jgi:hypothetical protein